MGSGATLSRKRVLLECFGSCGLVCYGSRRGEGACPPRAWRRSFTHLVYWSPEFDPRPFLGPRNRLRFERPFSWAASSVPLKPVPPVRVHCQAQHLRGFLELLDAGNRLELVPLRVVDYSRTCGVFAVAKDAARDRLVLDSRPANAFEDPANPWVRSLAAVEQLRYVFLEEDEDMFVTLYTPKISEIATTALLWVRIVLVGTACASSFGLMRVGVERHCSRGAGPVRTFGCDLACQLAVFPHA